MPWHSTPPQPADLQLWAENESPHLLDAAAVVVTLSPQKWREVKGRPPLVPSISPAASPPSRTQPALKAPQGCVAAPLSDTHTHTQLRVIWRRGQGQRAGGALRGDLCVDNRGLISPLPARPSLPVKPLAQQTKHFPCKPVDTTF